MYRIAIEREDDVYIASTIGKMAAEDCGLNKSEQTKLVVSIMELSRNIVYYAGKGEIFINPIKSYGIEIIAVDKGPGIKDIDKILRNEIPSKKGLGLGLSGVMRLMDEFEITSNKKLGTKVRAVKWIDERQGKHYEKFSCQS
ncbi:putative anti-sigma regulatory factor, serine/threonine protein kinase [Bacillus methanolicus PB1]|uniref:Putative anti-sigma regulatory factor, serine/threonine protein kinase n=1 Tax=Bacillus methanolicus PB1 TaxID=997296 RepID=I3E2A8_BACMT|nr:ATP-binding protein [Bacillus methanolicus]EIJ80629.1 putative anti-sigma regulatory factor, serine/threonine protein kinase [Bacillus methanolicus PB1]